MKVDMNRRINVLRINALLLILLSFFYMQEYSTAAIIMISLPLVTECILLLGGLRRFAVTNSTLIGIVLVVYTIFSQLFIMNNTECLSFLFSIAYFIFSFNSIRCLPKDKMMKYIYYMMIFGIILLIVDTLYRFNNPVYADFYVGRYWFYRYKSKGFLFVDTNNTGMLCLAILSLLLYLNNVHGIKYKKINLIYVILLALTFSRAAILAYIVMIIFMNKKVPKYLKVLAFLVCTIAAFGLIPNLVSDASTSEKFGMFTRVFDYWKEASVFELLFGVGFTNSINVIGLFTHSWPLTFTFEFGFIGFVLIMMFWCILYKESNKKASYILLPCLFAGVSFLPLLIPYVYAFIALIIVMEEKKEGGNLLYAN